MSIGRGRRTADGVFVVARGRRDGRGRTDGKYNESCGPTLDIRGHFRSTLNAISSSRVRPACLGAVDGIPFTIYRGKTNRGGGGQKKSKSRALKLALYVSFKVDCLLLPR